jgi:hypothetical protein
MIFSSVKMSYVFFGIKTVSWQVLHKEQNMILVIFLYEIYETTSDYIFTTVHMIPCASACAQGMEGARKGDEHVY